MEKCGHLLDICRGKMATLFCEHKKSFRKRGEIAFFFLILRRISCETFLTDGEKEAVCAGF